MKGVSLLHVFSTVKKSVLSNCTISVLSKKCTINLWYKNGLQNRAINLRFKMRYKIAL